MSRTLVAGSRGLWPEVSDIATAASLLPDRPTEVISGGARGVDQAGERYAEHYALPVTIIRPDWSTGRDAGFRRNSELVELADQAIVFWDGESRGTADTLAKIKAKSIPLVLIKVPA